MPVRAETVLGEAMHNLPEYLRQRYFTDAKFYHTVNGMTQLMVNGTLSPNEMTEALDVAKAKYYLNTEERRLKEETHQERTP